MKKQDNVIIGIYKITNPKGKIYIGQSIDIKRRENSYKKLKCKDQPKIYNSINRYGWEQHVFEIIEECNLDQLNEKEIYWKKYFLNQNKEKWNMVLFCNIHDNGNGPLSNETKLKIGKGNKGKKRTKEQCLNISNSLKGRIITWSDKMAKPRLLTNKMKKPKPEGFGEKISESNKNKPQPEGFVEKLTKSNQKHYIPGSERNKKISNKNKKIILQYDLDGNFIKEWESINLASVFINVQPSGISCCLTNKQKTSGGYIWKYKNP